MRLFSIVAVTILKGIRAIGSTSSDSTTNLLSRPYPALQPIAPPAHRVTIADTYVIARADESEAYKRSSAALTPAKVRTKQALATGLATGASFVNGLYVTAAAIPLSVIGTIPSAVGSLYSLSMGDKQEATSRAKRIGTKLVAGPVNTVKAPYKAAKQVAYFGGNTVNYGVRAIGNKVSGKDSRLYKHETEDAANGQQEWYEKRLRTTARPAKQHAEDVTKASIDWTKKLIKP